MEGEKQKGVELSIDLNSSTAVYLPLFIDYLF
jgi:hypothetical protein